MKRLAAFLLALLLAVPALANWCGVPGRDGSATLSGIVNTYYPGTADVNAGGTTIQLGPATGAGQAISTGDLLLVIQMQDGAFDRTNDSGYGDNVSGGFASGYTGIQQAGRYEFVRANGNLPASGGSLSIRGATGGGLVNAYRFTALGNTNVPEKFQVIKVPQHVNVTIAGTVTARAWDGSTGGVVVLDVAGRLTFAGGTISASGQGFRGGGGRSLAGGSGSNGDYRTLASNAANAAKGEGIVGTPRYVANGGSLLDNGVEGYRDGSQGRGAPGNAGGGGTDGNPAANDQNTGGGGGGNGGAGGRGGHAWCSGAPVGCAQSGGHPGGAIGELDVGRVTMGGGGGAGTSNNATGSPGAGFASSGAAGGGIVIVRAGEIAGTGTISANGASGNSTILNDGSGGGGAGGSVLLAAVRTVAGAALSVDAAGGTGGSNTGGGSAHGPGGGGGGGFIASSISVATNVSGGSAGTTQNGGAFGPEYGATAAGGGSGIAIVGADIPGLSSGGECTPTVVKSFATSPITPGTPSRMSIAVTNNNPTLALTALAFTDNYPAGLVNTATPAAARSCANAATLNAAAGGSSFAVSSASINAAASCTYSVNTTVTGSGDKTNILAAGALTGSYASGAVASLEDASAVIQVSPPLTILKSSQAYLDPQNGTTNPKLIPGAFVAYTVTVANPGSYSVDTDSVIVVDATPANLHLFVGNVPGGSGPVLFQNGSPSSGLSYTFSGLASGTDDLDFSSDGGASWSYTPTMNASGVDPNVTHIRIRPKGSMAAGSSFNLLFGYLIQ